MRLREREAQLRELRRALASAAAAHGCTVLVVGEAGIGKTALVERFADEASATARVLWGACEAPFTRRPLGPPLAAAYMPGARELGPACRFSNEPQ